MFQKELQHLINKYSIENESNTPDYILAKYLKACLEVFESAVKERDLWHSFTPRIRNPESMLDTQEFEKLTGG